MKKPPLSSPEHERHRRSIRSPQNLGLPDGGKFIGYARVSTNDQNPELQLDALRAADCAEVFVETASGTSSERPRLRAAIEAARPGDVLAVWKLDRLGRSLLQMIETVRELDARRVGFVSLTERIDTTTTTGRLVLHLFGAVAEFERSMIVERTLAGLEAARVRGRIGGRRKKLTDQDVEAGRALLHRTDTPITEIARKLGVSISTFYKYFPASKAQRARRR